MLMEEMGFHSKCEAFHFLSALRTVVQCVIDKKLLLRATPLLGGGGGWGGEEEEQVVMRALRRTLKLITEGRKLEMKHSPVLLFSNSAFTVQSEERSLFPPSFLFFSWSENREITHVHVCALSLSLFLNYLLS